MTERSEAIDQLAAALVKAQAQFSAIPKDSTNPFYNSKYADLADVVKHAGPVLSANGLAIAQFATEADGSPALTTFLLHESGQFLADTMLLLLSKSDPQGQGSALTYARRYAYMAALGLVADADDDGNQASATHAPAASRPAQSAPRASGNGEASEPQRKALWAISKKLGIPPPANLDELSKGEASELIQKLQAELDAA